MRRSEALALLQDSDWNKRLQGARFLSRVARPEDRQALEAALLKESVVWIRSALATAIRLAGGNLPATAPADSGGAPPESDELEDLVAQATLEVTGRIVHEIGPIVGTLRFHAEREIETFRSSETHRHLTRLQNVLDAVDRLGRAAAAPLLAEINLPALISDMIESEAPASGVTVTPAGPDALIAVGDRDLLELILGNALRNAVEATLQAESPRGRVIISWGATDRDYWVSILDEGIGLPADQERLFAIGASSKDGHSGMGLAIVSQAARSLGATVSLSRREQGGTQFMVRWPIQVDQ